MKDRKFPGQDIQPERDPFVTIDDLVIKSQELYEGLQQLSEYKHPLDIRRGINDKRKGVVELEAGGDTSRTVKAGSKTYFFDIKETKDDKPYLLITESRFKGDGEERERVTIAVFPENAQAFLEATSEMIEKLN